MRITRLMSKQVKGFGAGAYTTFTPFRKGNPHTCSKEQLLEKWFEFIIAILCITVWLITEMLNILGVSDNPSSLVMRSIIPLILGYYFGKNSHGGN